MGVDRLSMRYRNRRASDAAVRGVGRKRELGMLSQIELPSGPTSAGRWTSCRMPSPTAAVAVVDDVTRESLALIPHTSLSDARVAPGAGCLDCHGVRAHLMSRARSRALDRLAFEKSYCLRRLCTGPRSYPCTRRARVVPARGA